MELKKIDDKTMAMQGSNDSIYSTLSALYSYYTISLENLERMDTQNHKGLNNIFLEYSRKVDEVKHLIYQYQCLMGFDPVEL
ncbi:hypothetical protein KDU71_02450 [Carboxylicivirga sediminis]|uniref:Uncharacterized protein n=1 Tax=Carboxylicivirga sediminis TaxID=2006564 RepID=A0A941IUV5_9BACT|nr:hypothetical protein [Carboxylicivirga sediminis]MBR8534405.1 hypothetical protein [Carboxylicivirga sediminis]